MDLKRTVVYVDGFNLYYGSLKENPTYKWLNLLLLSKNVLGANFSIDYIEYFTAPVKPNSKDDEAPIRQQLYLRALRTIPTLNIKNGSFIRSVARRRLVTPTEILIKHPLNNTKSAATVLDIDVYETNEKGSDVNLATKMLIDGFANRYDAAAIITNDSDQVAPIYHVKKHLKKPVYVLNPQHINPKSRPSRELQQYSTKFINIENSHLASSQFPSQLTDKRGIFHKPLQWF